MGITGKAYLRSLLNKLMKIKLCDGRILIGVFLCTDRDLNVILGSCTEYTHRNVNEIQVSYHNLFEQTEENKIDRLESVNDSNVFAHYESRVIGLAMIPGKYIVSTHVDIELDPSLYIKVNTSNVNTDNNLTPCDTNKTKDSNNIKDIELNNLVQNINDMYI